MLFRSLPLRSSDLAGLLPRAIRVAGKVEPVFVETVDEVPDALAAIVRDGDVVITMGAGSIGGVPGRLAGNEGVK